MCDYPGRCPGLCSPAPSGRRPVALDAYKNAKGDWAEYERRFLALMAARKIEAAVSREQLDGACLLCSEDKPHHCHRRLVAESLRDRWGDVEIRHL